MSKIVKKSALDELLDEWGTWRGKRKADETIEGIEMPYYSNLPSEQLAMLAKRVGEHRDEHRKNHRRFMAQCAAAFVAGVAVVLIILIVPTPVIIIQLILVGAIAALAAYIMTLIGKLRKMRR